MTDITNYPDFDPMPVVDPVLSALGVQDHECDGWCERHSNDWLDDLLAMPYAHGGRTTENPEIPAGGLKNTRER